MLKNNLEKEKIRVAINGFGRIGRLALRVIQEQYLDSIEVVAINDLSTAANLAYLYNHDTSYGRPLKNLFASLDGSSLSSRENCGKDGQKDREAIIVYANKEPIDGQWKGVDVVLECTGFFLTRELASKHLLAGASRVILSAPAKDDSIKTFVIGVSSNEDNEANGEAIISNASCTTNCITPVLKGLLEQVKIDSVTGVTVHAVTASQNLQDGVSAKDFRSGRAAYLNLIPTKTGAQKATSKLIPELEGKLELSSLRVPVLTGSVVYLNLLLEGLWEAKDINRILENIAKSDSSAKVIDYSVEELVSSDIVRNSSSCIIDSLQTSTVKIRGGEGVENDKSSVQIVLWYDNEWGYTNRLVEMVKLFV